MAQSWVAARTVIGPTPATRSHFDAVGVGQHRDEVGLQDPFVIAPLGLQHAYYPGVQPFLGFFNSPMNLSFGQRD